MSDIANLPETWRALRPPKCDPKEATKAFHEALIRDCLLYKHGEDAGREGAARALVHTITFLNKIGIPNPVTEPLGALALALTDLNDGIVTDLVKPSPKGRGRRRKCNVDDVRDGVIAAIAEAFELASSSKGWRHVIAMQQAAQAINRSKNFPSVSGITVGNIRTRVKAERDTFAKDQFDAITQMQGFLDDPMGAALKFLNAPLGAGNTNLRK